MIKESKNLMKRKTLLTFPALLALSALLAQMTDEGGQR